MQGKEGGGDGYSEDKESLLNANLDTIYAPAAVPGQAGYGVNYNPQYPPSQVNYFLFTYVISM